MKRGPHTSRVFSRIPDLDDTTLSIRDSNNMPCIGNRCCKADLFPGHDRYKDLACRNRDAMRCDACSAQGNAAACGVKSKHSGHRLFLLVSSPLLLGGRWAVIT